MNIPKLSSPFYPARLQHYVLAAAGPVAMAASNFLLSFTMLRLESPKLFGSFTVLFAAVSFTVALSTALFGAPLQALYAARGQAVSMTVASAAVLTALVAGPIFLLLGASLGLGASASTCYALFAIVTVLRSVGRAWCYAVDQPWKVALSDMSYAVVTLGSFAAGVALVHAAPADAVYPALALGTTAAITSLGRGFAKLLFHSWGAAKRGYGEIWRAQSRWSLQGVVQAEATANAHTYLLTLLAGTAAMAPIAASALLLRPINVIQNALVDYERPQIARFLNQGALHDADRSMRLFRTVLLLAWGTTVALAAAIVIVRPTLVLPADYDLGSVRLATALWAGVSLVVVLQVPWNVLLQAGGEFRILARAGLRASVVSVGGVLLAIALDAPIWTVAAIGFGWLASTVVVWRAAGDFRQRQTDQARLAGASA